MILGFKNLVGMGIYESSAPKDIVAIVRDMIIDPDTGKVVGFWVTGILGLQILLPTDVSSWANGKILVESEKFFQFPGYSALCGVFLAGPGIFSRYCRFCTWTDRYWSRKRSD